MRLYQILVLSILFSTTAIAQDLGMGLTGHYTFDGNLTDESALLIQGTGLEVTPVQGIDGSDNSAFSFDGNTSFIDLTINDREIEDEFTISAWIKTTSSKRQFVIGKYNSNANGYFLGVENGVAFLGGRSRNGNADFVQVYGQKILNDGEWHYIVGTASENEWRVKADCNEFTVNDTGFNIQSLDCDDPLVIGVWFQGNGFGEFRNFEGSIDEVRIYNRVLSDDEISLLCNIGVFRTSNDNTLPREKISIYPNPVENVLNVEFIPVNNEGYKFKIYNYNGILMKDGNLKPTILVNELPTGFYFIGIYKDENLIGFEKFIRVLERA